jgi:hypothetical protein
MIVPFSVVIANRFPRGLTFHPYPFQGRMLNLLSQRWRSSPTSLGNADSNPSINPNLPNLSMGKIYTASATKNPPNTNNPPTTLPKRRS